MHEHPWLPTQPTGNGRACARTSAKRSRCVETSSTTALVNNRGPGMRHNSNRFQMCSLQQSISICRLQELCNVDADLYVAVSLVVQLDVHGLLPPNCRWHHTFVKEPHSLSTLASLADRPKAVWELGSAKLDVCQSTMTW